MGFLWLSYYQHRTPDDTPAGWRDHLPTPYCESQMVSTSAECNIQYSHSNTYNYLRLQNLFVYNGGEIWTVWKNSKTIETFRLLRYGDTQLPNLFTSREKAEISCVQITTKPYIEPVLRRLAHPQISGDPCTTCTPVPHVPACTALYHL